jgi:XTP/dITP diphosphohydrolase
VPTASSPSDSRLVLATLNRAKAREIEVLLGVVPFRIVALADLTDASRPEETADTYAGNALLKARAASRLTGSLALADDSGLEVDALGGAPGPRSARYGGEGLSDVERVRLLLDALKGVPSLERRATFRCVTALVYPSGREQLAEGSVDGVITESPRGTGGFGYDPVFFYPPLDRTFAELSSREKQAVSHRAVALAAVRRALTRMV